MATATTKTITIMMIKDEPDPASQMSDFGTFLIITATT